MVVRGRGVMAWRCMRMVVVVVVMVFVVLNCNLGGGVAGVESARPIRDAPIAVRGESVVNIAAEGAAESDGWSFKAGGGGGGVDEGAMWDAEAESPPAQRQRDRSLWGMSKRLVPTGPNPLHN